ncbi:MAG: dTDP-4-dehydrorhamnose 3,5-epimerase [Pseudomonadota bacterium]
MKITTTAIADLLIIEPTLYGDERGFFFESFNQREFNQVIGRDYSFVQDNHSRSAKNVLRGLHYQIKQTQGKLVRVAAGEVYDIAVDLRAGSPTFGKWVGNYLSADNKLIMWIPPGFAHGFLVISDYAEFLYKTTDYYAPQFQRCIAWDDPKLAINWPLSGDPILSDKDAAGMPLDNAEVFS